MTQAPLRAVPDPPADALGAALGRVAATLRPPPRKLSLSEWADRNFYLSPESSAEPGKWRCLPYQREILDCFTDPAVWRVSVMKSGRIGWTKCMNVVVAYHVAEDPCPIMVVQPTVEDARGYSTEEVKPMVRDVPAVAALLPDPDVHEAGQTVLHKVFPGGSISFVGANSGRGFRRVSRKVVLFDEVDGYPPSAGDEGDQIRLGIKRTEHYWDRKVGAGSTPLVAGASRIEDMFEAGDQRRFHVPCPHCGHEAPLVFRGEHGHRMTWPEGNPREAYFTCQAKGCRIEHKDKRRMVAAGRWVAAAPFAGHASFHVWAAYSFAPNATWGQIASEFVAATREGAEELRTFVNTVLGETWQEQGEAPDWERLRERQGGHPRGQVPTAAHLVTAGVDVQRDRLVWEVVAWGRDRQSWSVDAGVIPGDTAGPAPWAELDELLHSEWPTPSGDRARIRMLAVDSGDATQVVYSWARRHPMSLVIATKGVASARAVISSPSAVDVTVGGHRVGYKVWPIGAHIAKGELYGWLRLPAPEAGAPHPPGYCHFPEGYGSDYFKQLTAEHLVKRVDKRGFAHYDWEVLPGRENHWLDCRVLARAAAALLGLDRRAPRSQGHAVPAATPDTGGEISSVNPPKRDFAGSNYEKIGSRGDAVSWLRGRKGGTRGPWIKRR